jgi:hypothetical protein
MRHSRSDSVNGSAAEEGDGVNGAMEPLSTAVSAVPRAFGFEDSLRNEWVEGVGGGHRCIACHP